MSTDPDNNTVILACDMSALSAQEREAHIERSKRLLSALLAIETQPHGYAFRLPTQGVWLHELAAFIGHEARCCPFLQFVVTVEANGGGLWLNLSAKTDPAMIQQFLRDEFRDYLAPALVAQSGWDDPAER